MVGRTAGGMLPEALHDRVEPKLETVAIAIRDYMHESGVALLASAEAPTLATA